MESMVPVRVFLLSQTASLSHARLLRAETLRTLRRDEALRWYAASMHASVGVPLNMASAHLEMARIHDARGERDRAIEHYGRATSLWQDADPSFRPRLSQAQQRLAELAGRPPY